MTKQLFAALLALVFCSTAGADLYVEIGTGVQSDPSWPFSPYLIKPVSTSDVPDWMPDAFYTFCVEETRFFTPGTTYRATIDGSILASGDTLKDSVKKMYAAFLNDELGALAGNDIQGEIWHAQAGNLVTSPMADIIGAPGAIAGWDNVKVLNLWGSTGRDKQSQLVMTPVPGAGLLAAIGLGLASWRLRRKKDILDS